MVTCLDVIRGSVETEWIQLQELGPIFVPSRSLFFPLLYAALFADRHFFLTLHTSKQKLQSPTVPVVVRVVCDRYRLAKKEPKFESFFFLFAFFRVLGFEILKT